MVKEMYDKEKHIKDTFEKENLSKELLYAQKNELIELEKAIINFYTKNNKKISILDIGIGNARILKEFVKNKEVWGKIKKYKGIDIAENCINISKKIIKKLDVKNKVDLELLDAKSLNKLKESYDFIILTWFTAGNFYPEDFIFENYKPGSYDISKNKKFSEIFEKAYKLLNLGGEIIIGSMYIDNSKTREKQEGAYKKFGWEIITNKKDSFVATKDGWWSKRFNKKDVYNYLDFIPKKNISFIHLDDYKYAMMVKILKK